MKVSQMPYARVDVDETCKKIDEFIHAFKNAESAEEQLALDVEIGKLTEEVETNMTLASIRFTQNTADKFYQAEKDYYDEKMPELEVKLRELDKCYLESKFIDELKNRIPESYFINARMANETIDNRIIDQLTQENKLITEYTKIMSSVLVEFKGNKYTLSQMTSFNHSPDRKARKQACIATGKAMNSVAGQLDEIYDKLVEVRTLIAKKLGFKSFSEVAYRRLGRNCYDQFDVAKFRDNVRKYVVPLICEIKQKVAADNGIRRLALYDNEIYSSSDVKPIGDAEQIFANGRKMYGEMHPDTAKLFSAMEQAEAFDLLSRENKWGGGYCTGLPEYKIPFIMSNFNGSLGDVDVLTHEFGHALESYYSYLVTPPSRRGSITMDTCEVHSMSMEFFAYKWMDLFFGDKKQDYIYNHVAGAICFIPYGTIVDFFQQTAYDYYNNGKKDRNRFWSDIEGEFLPYMSSKGLPYFNTGRRWQMKAHIFETPFYYIDYCVAQMTAFQFLALMREDYDAAFEKYLQFLKIGGTKTFLETVEEVGLISPFEEEAFKKVTDTVRKILGLKN